MLTLLRILTDRGTEYCGKAETHDYQLYLAVNNIENTKTKASLKRTTSVSGSTKQLIRNFIR
jgi:hypothetical protein